MPANLHNSHHADNVKYARNSNYCTNKILVRQQVYLAEKTDIIGHSYYASAFQSDISAAEGFKRPSIACRGLVTGQMRCSSRLQLIALIKTTAVGPGLLIRRTRVRLFRS